MKFTEGDWVVKHEFNVMCGNRVIASCGGHSDSSNVEKVYEENINNALLISKSLEMYKALKHISEYWNGYEGVAVEALEHIVITANKVLDDIEEVGADE